MSSKNRITKSLPQDKYYTPEYAIKSLTDRIDFENVISFLEPCLGDGRILKFIPHDVHIQFYEIDLKKDYLTSPLEELADLIITNPPFSLSIEFLQRSLVQAKTVCYLQRLNWLGSKTRKDFWNEHTPDKIFILSKRPQFMKEMGLKNGSDSTEYAWFIWDKLNIVKGKHLEIL